MIFELGAVVSGFDSKIFTEIRKNVIESLENDDQFSDALISKIRKLFETGKIADEDAVLKVLDGDSDEDI